MKPCLVFILLTCALAAWLFAPALGGWASFPFRDATYYYHPLFEYIRDQWQAGRPPLWNPYENLGVPLVAENTSSVFYPGKLLFALPLDYTWLYNVYIVSHVVLAAATSYSLARRFHASSLAAGLAGLAYAFSGDVLFQYSNVVFLVGASWLPLALLFADRMLRERSPVASVGMGLVLALIILGGDPQMAYNALLLTIFYAILLRREDRHGAQPLDTHCNASLFRRRPALVGLSLLVAAGLGAIQILPTVEAGPRSERSRYDAPRSVYELARDFVAPADREERFTWYEGLLDSSHKGHHEKIYHFSLAPAILTELFWPNFTGRPFPTDNRWLRVIGLETLLWFPSVYMGLAPVVLALSTWSLRREAPLDVRFWSWTALFGMLASLGVYGVGWLVRQLLSGTPLPGVGDETGGFYWWMVLLLPLYAQFRYPAKLFVVASLALSILAARGWEQSWQVGHRRVFVILAGVPIVSLVAFAALTAYWADIEGTEAAISGTKWMGPFNWQEAWNGVVDGLLHATLLAVVLFACFWIGSRRPRDTGLMQMAVLVITALDLAVAQEHLIGYAPASDWSFEPRVVGMLAGQLGTSRVFRQLDPVPKTWQGESSPDRYVQWLLWDRETLWPKYPLPYKIRLASVRETIAGNDYHVLLNVANTQYYREHGISSPHPSVLDLVAARFGILDEGMRDKIASPREIAEDMYLGTRPGALPRAWIVHQVEVLPPLESRSPTHIRKWTENLLFPDNQPRNWRQAAVVESDAPLADTLSSPPEAAHESCRIVRDEPQHVEIEASLATPGLVVLSDQFYPGWQLTVEAGGRERDVPILRTNHVMRGVVLPAGRHRLAYHYRPLSIIYGAIISGLSAGGLALFGAIYWWRGRNTGLTRSRPADRRPTSS